MLYTRPHHEKKVAAGLLEIQVEHYLPMIKTLREWSDRKKYVDLPLFPSYIFVFVKNMENYYEALELEGVLHYVRIGKEPARVDEKIVNSVRLSVEGENEIEVCDEYFPPGKQLVINEGPMTGLACEAVRYKGKEKYLVRVSLLKRCILLTISADCLMEAISN